MTKKQPDIKTKKGAWFYSEKVKQHFFNPYKFMKDDEKFDADGVGRVGSSACGDVMKFWIKVDKKGEKTSLMCTHWRLKEDLF